MNRKIRLTQLWVELSLVVAITSVQEDLYVESVDLKDTLPRNVQKRTHALSANEKDIWRTNVVTRMVQDPKNHKVLEKPVQADFQH